MLLDTVTTLRNAPDGTDVRFEDELSRTVADLILRTFGDRLRDDLIRQCVIAIAEVYRRNLDQDDEEDAIRKALAAFGFDPHHPDGRPWDLSVDRTFDEDWDQKRHIMTACEKLATVYSEVIAQFTDPRSGFRWLPPTAAKPVGERTIQQRYAKAGRFVPSASVSNVRDYFYGLYVPHGEAPGKAAVNLEDRFRDLVEPDIVRVVEGMRGEA